MTGWKFRVLGAGNFPVDMLRHGGCWPEDAHDVHEIANFNHCAREVRLIGIRAPSERWQSFGWKITEQTKIKL